MSVFETVLPEKKFYLLAIHAVPLSRSDIFSGRSVDFQLTNTYMKYIVVHILVVC